MFIPLFRTPLARYAPLKASSQLTRHVSPVSAALTRSYSAATKTKAKTIEPAKAKRGKESKVDGRKKNSESPNLLLEFVHLVDFCFFASQEKPSPPRHPTNSFIRFSAHYYKTHEVKQPIAVAAGDIKRAYDKLTPEEKEVCSPVDFFFVSNLLNGHRFFFCIAQTYLPTDQELEDYKTRRAEWLEKTKDAKYKAKLSGYQLYVRRNVSCPRYISLLL